MHQIKVFYHKWLNYIKNINCSIVALEEIPKEDTNKYGVIAGNEIEPGIFMVKDMVEKPEPEVAPSNLAIIGRYILTPDIFDIIERQNQEKVERFRLLMHF